MHKQDVGETVQSIESIPARDVRPRRSWRSSENEMGFVDVARSDPFLSLDLPGVSL